MSPKPASSNIDTLPDLLGKGLCLVFVGINPGIYSSTQGHYYANQGNLFWWALNNSGLVSVKVTPEDDVSLLNYGIGFTDVVKRPSNSSSELSKDEFRVGAANLITKIRQYRPLVACFNGLTGYRQCFGISAYPGPQELIVGRTKFFVIPSTSRRNARYQKAKILSLFIDLKDFLYTVTNDVYHD